MTMTKAKTDRLDWLLDAAKEYMQKVAKDNPHRRTMTSEALGLNVCMMRLRGEGAIPDHYVPSKTSDRGYRAEMDLVKRRVNVDMLDLANGEWVTKLGAGRYRLNTPAEAYNVRNYGSTTSPITTAKNIMDRAQSHLDDAREALHEAEREARRCEHEPCERNDALIIIHNALAGILDLDGIKIKRQD